MVHIEDVTDGPPEGTGDGVPQRRRVTFNNTVSTREPETEQGGDEEGTEATTEVFT